MHQTTALPDDSKALAGALDRIFDKYRAGKTRLDERIVNAEEWWKLRHWRSIRPQNSGEPEPTSAWLDNVIMSKHSDAVDAYPEPVCLAREESDEPEAKMLSSILPVVLQQNDFAQVWSDVWWYKLKSGTGVYGVFWDPGKLGGLGDIAIQKVDILNLFWEPGVRDIQDSEYVFCVAAVNNSTLVAQYPQLSGKLTDNMTRKVTQYRFDDSISMDGKSLVVDCYLKSDGKVHLIKYVGDEVLADTRNTGGLYDHGMYPFVFDALFPEEGYPNCGFGYVDLCRDPQASIDILNNCILQNTIAASTPRWFIRLDGGVNETEYADLTKKFVHVTGRVDEDSVRQIVTQPVPGQVLNYAEMLVTQMKETSGNRDVNNGSTSASVTAASAIAALQEAGNGLSRDMISSAYRAFRRVVEMSIELIRQFYTLPRRFRITGAAGIPQYVLYNNSGLQDKPMPINPNGDMGARRPVFDIEVEVQAESAYTKQAYNDLAIQLYNMGIFNPAMADQALMMLDMMDFKGRDNLIQQIQQKQMAFMMQQQLLQASAVGQSPTTTSVDQTTATPESDGQSRVERARDNARNGAMPR